MSPANWIAIVFGILGFVVSVISLIRSFQSEAKADRIDLKQKKQELLSLTIECEVALDFASQPLRQLIDEAEALRKQNLSDASNEAADQAKNYAEYVIKSYGEQRQRIKAAREELAKPLPRKDKWASLLEAMDEFATSLKPLANRDLLTVEDRQYIFLTRENFRLVQAAVTR